MPNETPEDQIAPLDIYLAYDYLPATQYAKMLDTLDQLYEAVANSSLDDYESRYYEISSYDLRLYFRNGRFEKPWLPLCIDSVETGNSINVRFAAKGKSGSMKWSQGDLDVILPRSTAPLCAIGVILTGGVWSYERYLHAQHQKVQTQNVQAQTAATQAQERLTAAQVELTRAQTSEILLKQKEPNRQKRTSSALNAQFVINTQVQNFYSIINQNNIVRAEVNGVVLIDNTDRD